MFYYLYQITNLVNNKIYVGVHKTHDMDDGYMGSGKVIKRAIEKYGTDNFRKDILETFQNAKFMYAREKELVTEEFLSREDVYNLRRGGHGGFDYINNIKNKEYYKIRIQNGKKYNFKTRNDTTQIRYGKDNNFYQKKTLTNFAIDNKLQKKATLNAQSDSVKIKRKMTMKSRKHQQKSKNSQFGTIWITNGKENLKIKSLCVMPEGWSKGRTLYKK